MNTKRRNSRAAPWMHSSAWREALAFGRRPPVPESVGTAATVAVRPGQPVQETSRGTAYHIPSSGTVSRMNGAIISFLYGHRARSRLKAAAFHDRNRSDQGSRQNNVRTLSDMAVEPINATCLLDGLTRFGGDCGKGVTTPTCPTTGPGTACFAVRRCHRASPPVVPKPSAPSPGDTFLTGRPS